MRLLLTRHDRLGDFMLAWPAIQTLALNLPEVELSVLASPITAELATWCKGVQDVVCFPRGDSELVRAMALARSIRPAGYEAAIALFSRFDLALGLWLARIPMRVAPATKVAQCLYNHRLVQHRSRSERPEYAYNIELVDYFLNLVGIKSAHRPCAPYLQFSPVDLQRVRIQFAAQLGLANAKPWVFLHAGHGGSAARPPVALLVRIARCLADEGAEIILSEGPQDHEAVMQLSAAMGSVQHVVYRSESGLVDYAHRLALSDLFVGGSTGPLHLAGALDRPTVGFYPRRRSATSLRWQTLNRSENRLAFMPPVSARENDLGALDFDLVSEQVRQFFREVLDRAHVTTKPRT